VASLGLALAVAILGRAASAADAAAPTGTARPEVDDERLLRGVGEIAAPGPPGALVVFGPRAFALVSAHHGGATDPVVAAARAGRGRVVALSDEGFFDPREIAKADTAALLENAIAWAAQRDGRGAVICARTGKGLPDWLGGRGYAVVRADDALLEAVRKAAPEEVVLVKASGLSSAEAGALAKFVEAGGGLIVAAGAPRDRESPAARLLAPFGIASCAARVERGEAKTPRVARVPPDEINAALALDALLREGAATEEIVAQRLHVIEHAAEAVPPDDRLFRPRMLDALEKLQETRLAFPVKAVTPEDRLHVRLLVLCREAAPPERVRPAPDADVFPGKVPKDAPRVKRRVAVDPAIDGWKSTGLYAPPGEVVRVRVPPAWQEAGLSVRIGANAEVFERDALWEHFPRIWNARPIRGPLLAIANAHGGLVYVVVPSGLGGEAFEVEIEGVVAAPHFVLGKTSLADWRKTVRGAPAPWAELETAKVVLTVPSEEIRGLDDPDALLCFWDRVLDSYADLGARPLAARPERLVRDSHAPGTLHNGYPIKLPMARSENLVDLKALEAGGSWGPWHELGHNHVRQDWCFDGVGEVVNNVFVLHAIDRVVGVRPWDQEAIQKKGIPRAKLYFATHETIRGGDPFAKLVMYAQIQREFGWEPFRKVFAEYRDLRPAERPKNDDEKRDQWLVRLSRAVGRDLGPFFQAWGVPTSDAARRSVAGLPAWTPTLPPRP
jgi:hypothetical protein